MAYALNVQMEDTLVETRKNQDYDEISFKILAWFVISCQHWKLHMYHHSEHKYLYKLQLSYNSVGKPELGAKSLFRGSW